MIVKHPHRQALAINLRNGATFKIGEGTTGEVYMRIQETPDIPRGAAVSLVTGEVIYVESLTVTPVVATLSYEYGESV